jgi:4-phosphopantoate--beta-alanine ligase
MGKTVIVVDLNPLSRSAKMASITIVDEISRVSKSMLNLIQTNDLPSIQIEFNNDKNLQASVNIIAGNYRNV